MKKILLSLLALMSLTAMAETYTITYSDIIGGGNGTNKLDTNKYGSQDVATESTWYNFVAAGIQFTGSRICQASTANGGVIQVQGSKDDATKQGFIGNKSAFKSISKFVIYARTTASNTYVPSFNLYMGSSELPTSGAVTADADTVKTSDSSYKYFTINYAVSGASAYFAIRNDLAGALYIDKIEITGELAAAPIVTMEKPSFSIESGTYYEAQNVTITAAEGRGVIYTTDGTTPADGVGTYEKSGKATVSVSKTTTIKAISVDNDDPDNCSGVSEVSIEISKKIANTPATAYTPAEANAFAKEGASKDSIYVKGIITSIKSLDTSKYKSAQYYIGATVDATETFYIYNGLYLGKQSFTSDDQIKVGDEVIVYGAVTAYTDKEGNTTYEMAGNNYLYSINGTVYEEVKEPVNPISMAEFTNGGFEAWTNNVADQWKSITSASNATVSQSTDAHGGSNAALVAGAKENKRLASTEIKLAPGSYTIEAYVKTDADSALVRVGYCSTTIAEDGCSYNSLASNAYKYGKDCEISKADGWVKASHTFTLQEEVVINICVMNNKKYASDVIIDDVVLREATKEETSIESISTAKSADVIYSAAGQKLNAPIKGINIINGKKVLVK